MATAPRSVHARRGAVASQPSAIYRDVAPCLKPREPVQSAQAGVAAQTNPARPARAVAEGGPLELARVSIREPVGGWVGLLPREGLLDWPAPASHAPGLARPPWRWREHIVAVVARPALFAHHHRLRVRWEGPSGAAIRNHGVPFSVRPVRALATVGPSAEGAGGGGEALSPRAPGLPARGKSLKDGGREEKPGKRQPRGLQGRALGCRAFDAWPRLGFGYERLAAAISTYLST